MRHFSMLALLSALMLSGCGTSFDQQWQNWGSSFGGKAEDSTSMRLEKTSFDKLPGWGTDQVGEALLAMQNSCAAIKQRDPARPMNVNNVGGTAAAWRDVCNALDGMDEAGAADKDATVARQFIQTWFDPYVISTPAGKTGLFTGYYEPGLRGSLTQQGPYQYPLYQRPPDLVMAELGDFRDTLQGQRIAGRVINGALKPYEDRAAIDKGALAGKNLELLWVDNPYDAFFLQIQGSGRVTMNPNGTTTGPDLRLGYDGQNGYPYTAIGAELVKRGALSKEQVSLQTIRQWMETHPAEAPALMQQNKSYVFFRVLEQDQPQGASGVGLTPLRSLAVDPRFIPYGAPVWLDVPHPTQPGKNLQQLFIAQDTGGAIRGPVRGDVFWGHGPEAEKAAGAMKARGQAWLLLPKNTNSVTSMTVPTTP
ncbi:MAG TPA: murein transglycosylase A [Alphaproteobacteria bacterium]